ncbi:MAG: sigma-70 family RNA polymerase sigma factor [Chloroflexi bacterium]|nr:sigma-70 family RNA polymerase sigma factor [Chloroflexota bacterium]MBI3338804.1 sigma-70 family RNA polymerase sigma factor [Chloroflexota bacterium]
MEKAGVQGYLTTDDLMEVFPDSARNSEKLRALFAILQHRGVDVVDTDEEAASDTAPEADSSLTDLDSHSNEHLSGDDPIGLYLKEMTRVPLLSMEDELSIAIRIEKGRRAKAELLTLSSRNLTASRRKLELLVQDGSAAREHLIKANTRLVVSIAKRYMGRGVAFLDLIQEGNLGLMKAVEKYDYHRGFRFSTYATWWIRQTISRALADQARTIRVPVHMIDRIRMLYKATQELEQKLGRQPTIEELAENVKLSVEKVQWIHKVSWQPLSLESPAGEDGESEMGMFIRDDLTPSPQQNAYESMLKDKLEEVLTSLSPREARVLRLRFGLDDGNIYTLEEVGQKFGLTRERIRQIEGKALRQLRNPRKARELKEYL